MEIFFFVLLLACSRVRRLCQTRLKVKGKQQLSSRCWLTHPQEEDEERVEGYFSQVTPHAQSRRMRRARRSVSLSPRSLFLRQGASERGGRVWCLVPPCPTRRRCLGFHSRRVGWVTAGSGSDDGPAVTVSPTGPGPAAVLSDQARRAHSSTVRHHLLFFPI